MRISDFLMEDENIQAYIDDQNAVPCKDGDFELAPMLDASGVSTATACKVLRELLLALLHKD